MAVYALNLASCKSGYPGDHQQHHSPTLGYVGYRWVRILLSYCKLPLLEQFIPLFDGLLHLLANHQIIIISDASNLLGHEVQEFIGSLLALRLEW